MAPVPTPSPSRGTIPGYETTFITRPEMSADALKAISDRLAGVISAYKGEIVLTEDWGQRKLAYPIQKEKRGQYTYIVYSGQGEIVHEIERNLRLQEHVLRFLTVNLEDEFDPEAFRKRRADFHAAAKRREEEREARREERMAERRGYGYEDRDDRHHHDHRRPDREEPAVAAVEPPPGGGEPTGSEE